MSVWRSAVGVGRRHRWAWASAAAVLLAVAGLFPASAPAGASPTPPQISLVAGHRGGQSVTVGHPVPAATAAVAPADVAYDQVNGDIAVVAGARVYLVAGSNEPNEYQIETGTAAGTPQYGTLVAGDMYLMAGTGTEGLVTNPGKNPTATRAGSTDAAAVRNPMAPEVAAFDGAGNLLVAEYVTGQASAVQVVARQGCSASCPYRLSKMAAGALYTVGAYLLKAVTATVVVTLGQAAAASGMAVDSQGDLALALQGGEVLFVNEQASALTRYGVTLPPHAHTLIVGTTTPGSGTCAQGVHSVPATGTQSVAVHSAQPAFDASGNLYVNDNKTSAGAGCTWVLPARSGSLDGMTVTAGSMYPLTGAATTPVAGTTGSTARSSGFPATAAVDVDVAGNVILALDGGSPSIRVLAESTGTYFGEPMTKGKAYTVSGGPEATGTTLPGSAAAFQLALPSSLADSPGALYLTDGIASTGEVYRISDGPGPAVTSITPASGSRAGGTTVSLTGTNLTGAAIAFATSLATIVSESPTQVVVTTPPHAPGTVHITVTTPGGTITPPLTFKYVIPKPALLSLNPVTGTTLGGTAVTLHGSDLTGATSVTFGTVAGTTVHVVNPTEVTVHDPAHTAAKVSVTLTSPNGTTTLASGFNYVTGQAPSAPTDVVLARAGQGALQASWTAPSSNGGQAITEYLATASPGEESCSTSGALTCTVSGLTDGIFYEVSVVATNLAGTGTPSVPAGLIPATAPGPPGIPTAVQGNGSATVRWTAPTPTTNGIPITKYTVTSTPTAKTCTWTGTGPYACTVRTLVNGKAYSFHVRATNAAGTGPTSAPSLYPATPEPVVPDPPVGVVAYAQNAKAVVLWTAPGTDGGSPVTGYVVASTPAGKGCTTTGTLSCTVTGLTNGDSYSFTVQTVTAAGTSTTSESSLPVQPTTTPTQGYRAVASDGGVFCFGTSKYFGSMSGKPLAAPIVAVAATPTDGGYWEVGADGGVFAFGNATFYGSMGGKPLNQPIVALEPTSTGTGYWEIARDGGVFAFGNAKFYGSMGGKPLNQPIVVGMPTPTGDGYWEVASDGGVFSFGNGLFYGSMGGKPLDEPIVGASATPTGQGYWEVASDGGLFAFGSAQFFGSMGGKPLTAPVVGIAATPTRRGYWEVAMDGTVFPFGSAETFTSLGGALAAPVVGITAGGAEAAR